MLQLLSILEQWLQLLFIVVIIVVYFRTIVIIVVYFRTIVIIVVYFRTIVTIINYFRTIGVAGVDATLEEIEHFLIRYQWGSVYTFIINKQGETILHPKLKQSITVR